MLANPWILVIALSSTIASFAQILLKKSAMEQHGSFLKEYLNIKVIGGYLIMFLGMFMNIYAYSKGVEYKNGPVMESIGNIWVVFLSFVFFGEKITRKKILGNILIIAGIIIFYM
ncbi:MAG: multidrug ABC transporter [Lachnospiraceae bacterium]|nr:multidrug ABC transporter [Lachnospiraceae bacterium]